MRWFISDSRRLSDFGAVKREALAALDRGDYLTGRCAICTRSAYDLHHDFPGYAES